MPDFRVAPLRGSGDLDSWATVTAADEGAAVETYLAAHERNGKTYVVVPADAAKLVDVDREVVWTTTVRDTATA